MKHDAFWIQIYFPDVQTFVFVKLMNKYLVHELEKYLDKII
jgi:hypothetical protein